jgi:hypothetical protein
MAGAVDLPTAMGYHLWADTRHDFGAGAPIYNIRGANAPGVNGAPVGAGPEAQGLNYFLSGDGRAFIADADARGRNTSTFAIPEETAAFRDWIPPQLYVAGNSRVGIIQDAGHFITLQLGAKNVITFGSILDPATKPAGGDRQPIWFDPQVNDVTIPLAIFGFDPEVITSIHVHGLTAGTVKTDYDVPGARVDAIAMALPPLQPVVGGKSKPISKVDVGLAGFFTSIARAENLPQELTDARLFNTRADAETFANRYTNYFHIGKTLGDVTLVASAMPNFGGVANPYTGIGVDGGGWKFWAPPVPDMELVPPQVLMLKTGDQLNWVRAIVFGVGAIYEDQPKGARKIRQYQFFPGSVSDEEIRRALINVLLPQIATDVTNRYEKLVRDLQGLVEGDSVKVAVTTFAQEPNQAILTRPVGRQLSARLIADIVGQLGRLQAKVSQWVATKAAAAAAIADIQALRDTCEGIRVIANACSPAGSIVIKKDDGSEYLSYNVVVANIPRTAVTTGDNWPLKTSLAIMLRGAFGKLNNISRPEFYSVSGTDIEKKFLSKIANAIGIQQGGGSHQTGGAYAIPDVRDTVLNTVIRDGGAPTQVAMRCDPGVIITLRKRGDYAIEELVQIRDEFPQLKSFSDYCIAKEPGADNGYQGILRAAWDAVCYRDTRHIQDRVFVEALNRELVELIARGEVTFSNVPGFPARGTILFNAYTCFVNAANACKFGDQVLETDIAADFDAYEAKYLEMLTPGVIQAEAAISATVAATAGRAQLQHEAATAATATAVAAVGRFLEQKRPLSRKNEALLETAAELGITDPEDILYMATTPKSKNIYRGTTTRRKPPLGREKRGIRNEKTPVGAYAPVPGRIAGGYTGLQTRRSLYAKHVGGSAPAPRRGLYEGLR